MPRFPFLSRQNRVELVDYLMKRKSPAALRNRLRKTHPHDIGEALIALPREKAKQILDLLDTERLTEVFEHLEKEHANDLIELLDDRQSKNVLENMELDEVSELFQYMDDNDTETYRSLLSKQKQSSLSRLLGYDDLSAGGQMNARYIALASEMDVKEAMRKLVSEADQVEIIDNLFVVDEHNTLKGVVDLKELIVAKHPTTIEEIMHTNIYTAHVDDSIQEVITQIQKYDTPITPVVETDGTLSGILTLDDIMDAIEEESHDDYAKLAGVSTEDRIYDTAKFTARQRLPWLALMLGLNLIVTTVLSGFEETIAAITALVLFQPLILGMAGNIGTQSLAVTILRLTKETFPNASSIFKHLSKEAGIGVINGFILGVLGFVTATTFLFISPMGVVREGIIHPTQIGLVVSLAIFTSLTVSAFQASVIPLILNKLKIDPAIASGPFITTLNDITALVVYFGLASALILTLL